MVVIFCFGCFLLVVFSWVSIWDVVCIWIVSVEKLGWLIELFCGLLIVKVWFLVGGLGDLEILVWIECWGVVLLFIVLEIVIFGLLIWSDWVFGNGGIGLNRLLFKGLSIGEVFRFLEVGLKMLFIIGLVGGVWEMVGMLGVLDKLNIFFFVFCLVSRVVSSFWLFWVLGLKVKLFFRIFIMSRYGIFLVLLRIVVLVGFNWIILWWWFFDGELFIRVGGYNIGILILVGKFLVIKVSLVCRVFRWVGLGIIIKWFEIFFNVVKKVVW